MQISCRFADVNITTEIGILPKAIECKAGNICTDDEKNIPTARFGKAVGIKDEMRVLCRQWG
jgi:hypothetical protein